MGATLDPTSTSEMHNTVLQDGRVFVRPALAALYQTSITDAIVGAFTVENPRTTEPWHYIAKQSGVTGLVTLDVMTEEFATVYSVDLGPMPRDPRPVITHGVVNGQVMVSSPSMSATLYGQVGSGLVPAYKTPTQDPRNTALDVPTGHLCAWRDRIVIAQGSVLYINTGALDPRTFTAGNVVALPGTFYDLFEGPDGALWVFTSKDCYVLPVDALSQSQISVAFMATVPNVATSAPRNAVATGGTILALGRDGLVEVSTSSQRRMDVSSYEGRRFYTPDIRVDDMRSRCRIYATGNGAIVSYGGTTPASLYVDLRNGFRSFWWFRAGDTPSTCNVVGTLRARDGQTLYCLSGRRSGGLPAADCVAQAIGTDETAGTGDGVRGAVCFRASVPADKSPTARFITVSADNAGLSTVTYCAGSAATVTTPTMPGDVLLDTAGSLWGASRRFSDRDKRTVRHALAVRLHGLEVEVGLDGAGCSLDVADVQWRGQAPSRRSKA